MKVEVSLFGKSRVVDIPAVGPAIEAQVDGRRVDASISSPQPHSYLVRLSDNRILEIAVHAADDGSLILQYQSHQYVARIIDLKHQRRSLALAHDGKVVITAPMPGKVVSVLARVGDKVETGTGVVIVEAMKMQNELKSSKPGIVKAVEVEAGQTVVSGQTLVVIE